MRAFGEQRITNTGSSALPTHLRGEDARRWACEIVDDLDDGDTVPQAAAPATAPQARERVLPRRQRPMHSQEVVHHGGRRPCSETQQGSLIMPATQRRGSWPNNSV